MFQYSSSAVEAADLPPMNHHPFLLSHREADLQRKKNYHQLDPHQVPERCNSYLSEKACADGTPNIVLVKYYFRSADWSSIKLKTNRYKSLLLLALSLEAIFSGCRLKKYMLGRLTRYCARRALVTQVQKSLFCKYNISKEAGSSSD